MRLRLVDDHTVELGAREEIDPTTLGGSIQVDPPVTREDMEPAIAGGAAGE